MLNIGIGEMLFVLVLLLVFVGPERLPAILRWAGRQYAQVRRAAAEMQNAFMSEADMASGSKPLGLPSLS